MYISMVKSQNNYAEQIARDLNIIEIMALQM